MAGSMQAGMDFSSVSSLAENSGQGVLLGIVAVVRMLSVMALAKRAASFF